VWFNETGGAEVISRWALPGAKFEVVPDGAFRH
jgi:hypothetical protein